MLSLNLNVKNIYFLDMTENNLQDLDNIQHEQLIALRKENHELRLKIIHDKQRRIIKKKEFEKLQMLVKDAAIRLNEGSELIRKLQQHLKICQEKVNLLVFRKTKHKKRYFQLSNKTKALLAKDDTLRDYQSHIDHLNHIIRQLTDEKKQLIDQYTAQHLQICLNVSSEII